MVGIGTIANIAAVLAGGIIGMFFNGGLKAKYQTILMQALGLSVLFIGISGALKSMLVIIDSSIDTKGSMLLIISLVLGSVIGEWIDIEARMEGFGEFIKSKIKGNSNPKFVEGFVSTSLVTCVGAMAIVGSLQDGLMKDPSMLFTKSVLDGIISIIFASTLGIGVLFSVIPLGIYQGFITLFAKVLESLLSDMMIHNLSFIGSVLIFGIGVNLAFGKRFKVGNMLPSLIIVVIGSLVL